MEMAADLHHKMIFVWVSQIHAMPGAMPLAIAHSKVRIQNANAIVNAAMLG